ncbi:hypothetical protein O1611_g1040 [Lasiodiplodia mahajangana]|uniref:Uncharacterized protein n=1 Tax=Lasiodiplodia mahajangana TaxID=1108764 RepID=A0ACC2JYU9_9PEZI|nr:hypothetical protein O1611_g1040 [Lasiodiplodia mahajangana]
MADQDDPTVNVSEATRPCEENEKDTLAKQIEALTARLAILEAKCAELSGQSGGKPPSTNVEEKKEANVPAPPQEKTYEAWQVKVVTNKRDPDSEGGTRKDFEETKLDSGKSSRQGAAAILRRFFNEDSGGNKEEVTGSELEILDEHLRELLRRLLAHHPTHEFYGDPAKIESPYEALVMNWDLLIAESERQPENEGDEIARKALGHILTLLQENSGDSKLDDYFKQRESLIKCPEVFIVEDIYETWPEPDDRNWQLACWTYDWDGRAFRRRPITLGIPTFRGSKAISALQYCPFSEVVDANNIKSALITRGKKYQQCCISEDGVQRFKYNGRAITDKSGFRAQKATKPPRFFFGLDDSDDEEAHMEAKELIVESEVMIDFLSYYQYGPQQRRVGDEVIGEESTECNCSHCWDNTILAEKYHRAFDDDHNFENWTDLQYMLCPPRILGYILRDKVWAQLQVEHIDQIQDSDHAFRAGLHLKRHPGVGKTSTAQTLAAAAKKTLFSIGVGDIGTKAKKVESNLRRIFDLATKWKAILLMSVIHDTTSWCHVNNISDEVDVFVQSRAVGHQGQTTERNALVSVFLRVLETYQGILILTTNQIALFDVAIQSRVHVAIKYTSLDKQQSINIFNQSLDQYHRMGQVDEYNNILTWGRTELPRKGFDGRQLRNLIASAMGRAQGRPAGSNKMKLEDIQAISSNITAFKGDVDYQMRRWEEFHNNSRAY